MPLPAQQGSLWATRSCWCSLTIKSGFRGGCRNAAIAAAHQVDVPRGRNSVEGNALRTAVLDGPLAFRMRRVAAARANECGLQIFNFPQLAARLAGGFKCPIAPDILEPAVQDALGERALGKSGVSLNCQGSHARSQRLCRKPGMLTSIWRLPPRAEGRRACSTLPSLSSGCNRLFVCAPDRDSPDRRSTKAAGSDGASLQALQTTKRRGSRTKSLEVHSPDHRARPC
jgi:hypothetical protein